MHLCYWPLTLSPNSPTPISSVARSFPHFSGSSHLICSWAPGLCLSLLSLSTLNLPHDPAREAGALLNSFRSLPPDRCPLPASSAGASPVKSSPASACTISMASQLVSLLSVLLTSTTPVLSTLVFLELFGTCNFPAYTPSRPPSGGQSGVHTLNRANRADLPQVTPGVFQTRTSPLASGFFLTLAPHSALPSSPTLPVRLALPPTTPR